MKRRIIIIAVLALVAPLVVVLLVALNRATESTIDVGGFRVSVLGVASPGKPFTTEKNWHPWARKILPGRFQKWIPTPETLTLDSANKGSVFVVLEAASRTAPTGATLWKGWQVVEVQSLAGENFGTQALLYPGDTRPGGSRLWFAPIESFPRRDAAFRLKLLTIDGSELGSLRVPNPVRGSFPVWTPRALPQTVTNGDVTLTLKTLGTASMWRFQIPGAQVPGRSSAEYEVKSENPLWKAARVSQSTFHDATGNEGFPLPRSESAWRVSARVLPADPWKMPDAPRLTVTNVPTATPGKHTLQTTNPTVGGVFLQLVAINMPKTWFDTNSGPRTSQARPWVEIRTARNSIDPTMELLCHAFGPDQRDLGYGNSMPISYDPPGSMTLSFLFDDWTNGPLSRLEILVCRPKVFEFFVNPADVKTNSPAK